MIKNFKDYSVSLHDLPIFLTLGYIEETHAIKIDKFARVTLQNGILQTMASFGTNVSVNTFKPFNDNNDDLFILSDNIADTHEITIYYINTLRELKQANITLQGTTQVNLNTVIIDGVHCVWRMRNNTNTDNIGIIKIQDANSNVYCNMPITSGIAANGSLTGIFSIPKGYVGLIEKASINSDKGTDVKGAMLTRAKGGVFIYQRALASYESKALDNNVWITADEEVDLFPVGVSGTSGVCYLDYTILLLKKDFVGKLFRGDI